MCCSKPCESRERLYTQACLLNVTVLLQSNNLLVKPAEFLPEKYCDAQYVGAVPMAWIW
jgi:hypothetical protein